MRDKRFVVARTWQVQLHCGNETLILKTLLGYLFTSTSFPTVFGPVVINFDKAVLVELIAI